MYQLRSLHTSNCFYAWRHKHWQRGCSKLNNGHIAEIIMKTEMRKEQDKPSESTNNSGQGFNFEVWAKQVRPLLLASLNKRGNRD